MFEVDFDEFVADLEKDWARVVAEIRTGVVRGVGYGARAGAEAIRAGHTFKNQSGDLERGIVHAVIGWTTENTYQAKIVSQATYSSFVEKGTAPHQIAGRRNGALTFEWKGELVHFRYVMHPGTKPMPFMHLGFEAAEKVIRRELEAALTRADAILSR